MIEQGNGVTMITITADEYFDLRSRAEANNFMIQEMANCRTAFEQLSNKVWELEQKLEKAVKRNDR